MLVLPSRSEKFSKRKHQQNFFKFLLILVVIAVGGYKLLFNYAKNTASQNINSSSSSVETVVTHQASKVDWQSPSEKNHIQMLMPIPICGSKFQLASIASTL